MNKACAVVMMAGLGFDFDLGELGSSLYSIKCHHCIIHCNRGNCRISVSRTARRILPNRLCDHSRTLHGKPRRKRRRSSIRSRKTYGLNGIRTVIITTWRRNCTDRGKLLILIFEVNCSL